MKVVIVGGVAGGATAAARLRRLDEQAEIVVFERSGFVSYANCGLPYYIGGVIEDPEDLTLQTPESFYARFRIHMKVHHEVTAIHPDKKTVSVKNLKTGEEFEESYDKLLLSPGAKPVWPDLPGMDSDKLFTLRTVEDTFRIKEFVDQHKPKSAVMVGGGFIGLEVAENLRELGMDVTIVQRPKQLMNGNRLHEKPGNTVGELAEVIQRTLDRGGNVVIPSFAVGRTQEMLYAIRQIKQEGMVSGHDGFPVYVDSPLAVEATGIFLQCDQSCFDEETAALVRQGINPIWFDDICLSVTSDESKQINFDKRPKVILSASGMCEAGRIRHHLKHNLWGGENTILFVGYQAEGSLGRKLQNGAQSVRLFGEDITVNAQIAALHGTSGHADQAGLIRWLAGFREKPQMVFVNHGDDAACVIFQNLLTQMGYYAEAPYSGAEYDLVTGRMTVFADSKPIRREEQTKGSARARAVYGELLAAAEALLAFVKTCKGRTNKDNAKLTSQIRNLIEKWK